MKYLVTYDICKNKSRKKVSDILEGIGIRVNLSVFECELNQTKLNQLAKKLSDLANPKTDSIRFYRICENCLNKSFEICDREEIFESIDLYV
ncbi:CRISPR-associated endonuclease Cas2 [Campylobacter sp. FMV-PI01]|uniref:CRISPR-associated endoribonuclease Cas2 n=1 Tax=Campylobacter portucalensis TaxID=2608384 RepID=A0A6L5WI48_9BACT|nr:CRISPR-associated endonuclease Cas2 [Campylobacter portucalensis]MSN96880.1 CRISPR-associated endonuclease Cas2 [Campylobacter portucalensis]